MNEIECETCIKRKTKWCPNSSECFKTIGKPHYQNRIMLLEENQRLKEQLEDCQLQNFNLREDIMIKKISFPNKEIKDKSLLELYNMPSYEDLQEENKQLKGSLQTHEILLKANVEENKQLKEEIERLKKELYTTYMTEEEMLERDHLRRYVEER